MHDLPGSAPLTVIHPVGGEVVVGGVVEGGGGVVGGAEVVPPTTGQLEAQKPQVSMPRTAKC